MIALSPIPEGTYTAIPEGTYTATIVEVVRYTDPKSVEKWRIKVSLPTKRTVHLSFLTNLGLAQFPHFYSNTDKVALRNHRDEQLAIFNCSADEPTGNWIGRQGVVEITHDIIDNCVFINCKAVRRPAHSDPKSRLVEPLPPLALRDTPILRALTAPVLKVEPKKIVRWFNHYKSGRTACVHDTYEDVNSSALSVTSSFLESKDCIARIRVEFTEGQFDVPLPGDPV